MRNFVVLLSIASVLACPYECAAKLAAAQTIGSDQRPACCDRCQAHETTVPVKDQTPAPLAPNEDGRWCLCEGAVFDAGSRSVVDDAEQVSLWTWVVSPVEMLENDTPMPSFECVYSPPPLSGRFTRIAIRSLLL